VDAGQLVLMTLPKNVADSSKEEIICGIIIAKLGKKKPQNYEIFAQNDIWIATEYDLTLFKVCELNEIKLS
jgi:hypothetical protein